MLLRTSQQLGIDETFRNPPWDVGKSSRAVCQPLGRQSLGTHPALGQCDRCLMLESSNPFPGFAKPPWFCQESRPQAWGSAPCLGSWGFSISLTPKQLNLPVLSGPVKIHLSSPSLPGIWLQLSPWCRQHAAIWIYWTVSNPPEQPGFARKCCLLKMSSFI